MLPVTSMLGITSRQQGPLASLARIRTAWSVQTALLVLSATPELDITWMEEVHASHVRSPTRSSSRPQETHVNPVQILTAWFVLMDLHVPNVTLQVGFI